jgi:hypothetical protein
LVQSTEVSQLFEEHPICNRVEVVRTVDHLASVAEDIIKTRV